MKDKVIIFGKQFEYDFLSGWIKYNRLQSNLNQEALAYGICSTSHLSYFENGKKRLRSDIIESLLKKLNIENINNLVNMGSIRHNLYNMLFQIESFNNQGARIIYQQIKEIEDIIEFSPYNIEYKIYQLAYKVLVEGNDYSELSEDIKTLDKVYTSLNKELQYLFLFVSGRLLYKYQSHEEGIYRLTNAYDIKETPFLNYHLGFAYCFDNESLKGTYYLEKALDNYEKSGRYINALWCHNYLGICYTRLRMYKKANNHYDAALTGAKHFNIDNIFHSLYINLSHLCFCKKEYNQSIEWVKKALEFDGDPILPACNYIEASLKLDNLEKCKEIFDAYLNDEHSESKYYPYLQFLYLSIFHLEEPVFYNRVTQEILPYYEEIHYYNLCQPIKLKLIEHLEKNRKYKEGNKIYKELFDSFSSQS